MNERDLASELATLVRRYGTRVLEDADGLRATLDDFLDEGTATPGDVNLLIDTVRFGSLARLTTLLDQGAEPTAAAATVAQALAAQRGGDVQSAYKACTVLGYAAGLVPYDVISSTWAPPGSGPSPATAGSATLPPPSDQPGSEETNRTGLHGEPLPGDETLPPPSGGRPAVSADGPSGGDRRKDTTRTRYLWALAGVSALAVILAAGVVYLAFTREGNDVSNGNEVPVSAVLPDFDHFGANLERVLDVCGDASIPRIPYADYNCAFAADKGPFNLELTEQDPIILDSKSAELPSIVQTPPRGTIVTVEDVTTSYHAYYMEYKAEGNDGDKNTSDDEVELTLYDVDPRHPGAAIFTARDSDVHPLTRLKANELLDSIAADEGDRAHFPVPEAFQTSASLDTFARPFLSRQQLESCREAFTVIRGEREHVTCPDDSKQIIIDFGNIGDANRLSIVRRRYVSAQKYNWSSDAGSGQLMLSGIGRRTFLYWEDPVTGQNWGVLSSSTRDDQALLEYFKGFQDVAVPP